MKSLVYRSHLRRRSTSLRSEHRLPSDNSAKTREFEFKWKFKFVRRNRRKLFCGKTIAGVHRRDLSASNVAGSETVKRIRGIVDARAPIDQSDR